MLERIKASARVAKEAAAPDASRQERAQMGNVANLMVNAIVGLVVAAIVAAFLIPIGIDEIVAVNTTSWGSSATSIWDILDAIIALAVFLMFIGLALAASDRL